METKPDMRKGKALMTSTGIMFYPMDPRPEEVELEDITHHLAMENRFNGATCVPYSVGMHSIVGAQACLTYWPKDYETAFKFMIHDAPEAYSRDNSRPMKENIPELKKIEHKISLAIGKKFGVPDEIMTEKVREIDDNLLKTEFTFLMPRVPEDLSGKHMPELGSMIFQMAGLSFVQVKQEYLRMFDYLYERSGYMAETLAHG
jgi:hypothetical protein